MLFRNKLDFKTLVVLSLALTATGCGKSGFDAHFVSSEGTASLINEAKNGYNGQAGVIQLVNDRFGNPQKLNVWQRLPLDSGGVTGSVQEAPDPDTLIKSLKLSFDDEMVDLSDGGALLQIVTGEAATEVVMLKEWDPETGIGEVDPPLEQAPAAGDVVVVDGGATLKHGRVLYMRHCSHCHGTSGDGAGPTAEYLNPRPRDYRNGLFKFTSTKSLMRPARADLHRILKNGVPGTYMPSFVPMLDEKELHSVVEYIRFLAMRGEFERKMVAWFADGYSEEAFQKQLEKKSREELLEKLNEFYVEELPEYVVEDGDDLASAWEAAEDEKNTVVPSVARVEDSKASRQRGRELFVGGKLNCINCHGITAQGNGPQTEEYEVVDDKPRPNPGLHDSWGNLVKPRNLTTGIYRGGRRPIDIFRRLYSGINGAKMPAFGGKVSDEELWDVVNYVLSIPFESEPGHIPVAGDEAAAAKP